MKKHPLLAAGAAAGTAVLGAAYAVYRVAFYQKPTTKVPSPADMPTRECYRKAMGPDADALARDMFKAVHITAQDGTPLAARYYHHADGAPLAIIFHGYRGYAERDGLGGYTLSTALGYNVLLPAQRAHGYSGGHTNTMGVKERYDARDWTVWARSRFGPEVPIFLMGVSMGAATVLLAAGLNLPDNVCGIVADCGYTSPREITRKCLPEYLPGMPLELTYAVGRLGAILFGHFDPEAADCEAAAAQSKVPILFVHGDADGFVPYDMGKRNYEACRAKGKKFLTVHGAEHAVSYYHDNDAYTKQATEFLQDCLVRRGFVWPPETDEPEKLYRGVFSIMKRIATTNAPAALGPYAQAVDTGDTVYCSGQLGLDPATGALAEGVQAQTHQALKNLQAVLQEAGLTLDNVVKTTVFVQDLGDFGTVNEIYGTYFHGGFPARSCVQIAALPKGALVEIECIAVR